jgi:hypothetical protein
MRLPGAVLVLCLVSTAAFAQQLPVTSLTAPAAPISDEEIVITFNQISQRAARLEPMLEQLHPNDWTARGAPDTYIAQWTSILQQFRAVESDMATLAQHPGHGAEAHITDCLKALFRLQSTHQMLDSLMGGTRKYQNPALADLIESVASETNADVDRVQQYVMQISDEKEQQFSVVDREAQRCRATLSRQPAEPPRTNRKTQ